MDDYALRIAPDTVRIERLLPGPMERIWTYLTDPDKRQTWLAGGPMDLRVGGPVELVFMNSCLTGHDDAPPPKYARHAGESRMNGSVTACEPPRLLSYTWGEDSGERSEVRFELEPQGERVKLTVTHSRIASRDMMISVAAGWHTHLDILRDRLLARAPASFWPTNGGLEAEYDARFGRPAQAGQG